VILHLDSFISPYSLFLSRHMAAVSSRCSCGVSSSKAIYRIPHRYSAEQTQAPAGSSPPVPRSPWHFSPGSLLPCSFDPWSYALVYLRPFATLEGFWHSRPSALKALSSQFSPPVCYQLSSAESSSLLRTHLPPCTTSSLPCLPACSSLPSYLG